MPATDPSLVAGSGDPSQEPDSPFAGNWLALPPELEQLYVFTLQEALPKLEDAPDVIGRPWSRESNKRLEVANLVLPGVLAADRLAHLAAIDAADGVETTPGRVFPFDGNSDSQIGMSVRAVIQRRNSIAELMSELLRVKDELNMAHANLPEIGGESAFKTGRSLQVRTFKYAPGNPASIQGVMVGLANADKHLELFPLRLTPGDMVLGANVTSDGKAASGLETPERIELSAQWATEDEEGKTCSHRTDWLLNANGTSDPTIFTRHSRSVASKSINQDTWSQIGEGGWTRDARHRG
jgi:hypothetical protein